MTEELSNLISDFGGGRKKETEKSQRFYDLANIVLQKQHGESYKEIELFCEYLKEISKSLSSVNIVGIETT